MRIKIASSIYQTAAFTITKVDEGRAIINLVLLDLEKKKLTEGKLVFVYDRNVNLPHRTIRSGGYESADIATRAMSDKVLTLLSSGTEFDYKDILDEFRLMNVDLAKKELRTPVPISVHVEVTKVK